MTHETVLYLCISSVVEEQNVNWQYDVIQLDYGPALQSKDLFKVASLSLSFVLTFNTIECMKFLFSLKTFRYAL